MEISPEQLGTGGAIILGAMTILFRRGRQKEKTAGEKSPEWWQSEFARLTENALRNALAQRNEDIRRIVREELERARRD